MTSLYDMHQVVCSQIGSKLNKFCSPLAERFGVNHFYHYMLTDSGHFASLGLNQEWHERLYVGSEGYGFRVLPYLQHTKNRHKGLFFTQATQDENWKKMASVASEDFNVNFGLQIMVQTKEGLEGFGFALDSSDPYKHMMLVNELPLLQLFIREYKNEFHAPILKDNLVDVAGLIGPSFFEASNWVTSDSHQEFLKKMEIKVPSPFTKRECEIIHELLKGCSAPLIAENLCVSKRTVEHHLERIKSKLDCSSKVDLIQKLHDLESMWRYS